MRWARWLLVVIPVSWALAWLDAPPLAVFIAAGLAVVPLAAETALPLSEGVAVVLGLTYALSLVFSLVTHRQLFGAESHAHAMAPRYRTGVAIGILGGATALVAIESEILVHSTQAVVARFGLSELFLGLIVIPLIGNAAEHATAAVVAGRGQSELALHIALGSSTQVALFVAPVVVAAGAALGRPMNPVFTPFAVLALRLAALIVPLIRLPS